MKIKVWGTSFSLNIQKIKQMYFGHSRKPMKPVLCVVNLQFVNT